MSENTDRRLFRGGFIAAKSFTMLSKANLDWQTFFLNGITIKIHPDADVYQIDGNNEILLLGSAFDPFEKMYDEHSILNHLYSKAKVSEKSLHEALYTLSGKFSLIVKIDSQWRAYHDAMGSRSIFYSSIEPIIASHVELLSSIMNSRYSDMFIPFITSKNWSNRDVKYFPGSYTPYPEILQLTPNLFFDFDQGKPVRFWPNDQLVEHRDLSLATQSLEQHLSGIQIYIANKKIRALIGLTGGTDSRGVYCATYTLNPIIFSWVRSKLGDQKSSPDTRAAIEIASKYEQKVDIFQLSSPTLNDAETDLSKLFRISTGNYRGIDNGWLHKVQEYGIPYEEGLFVRGFGGEILRGFYQNTGVQITSINPRQLAKAYDVNSGSNYARGAFEKFIADSDFSDLSLLGRDPNDMFYWEHRMGTWGSIAMLEADIVVKSISSYNSRYLFDVFFGLEFHIRNSREAFHKVFEGMAPEISIDKISSV